MHKEVDTCEGFVEADRPTPERCQNPIRFIVEHPLLRRSLKLCGVHKRTLENVIDIRIVETEDAST